MTSSALRRPPIVALLAAEGVSSLGSHMTALALPWFVLATTGSPAKTAFVVGAEVVAAVVLGIPGGLAAARLGARKTMLICNLLWIPLVGLIPLLHFAGALSFPLLIMLAFLIGVLWMPFYAAQMVVMPEVLGDDERVLSQATALFQTTHRLTLLAGPALAGVLIAWVGSATILLLDAATFAVAFVLVAAFIPAVARAPDAPETPRSMVSGLRFLANDRLLRALTVAGTASQMAFQALAFALPVLAFLRFDENAKLAGLFLGAWGGGALVGSVVAYRAVRRFEPLRMASVAWFGQALPLWLLVLDVPAAAVVALLVVSGVGNGLRVPPSQGVAMACIPASLRSEAVATLTTSAAAGGAVALLVIGPAVGALGLTFVFAGIAALSTTSAVVYAAAAKREWSVRQPVVPA